MKLWKPLSRRFKKKRNGQHQKNEKNSTTVESGEEHKRKKEFMQHLID